jgi:ABC-type transport system substrate-binding protein
MVNFNWGYYSVFDADAILFDGFHCDQPFSYYCNKELDALIDAGRSTLDAKKRTEAYARAQKLLFDDAAAIFK